MGRVYDALLKADRLNGNRPIGRPANPDAGTRPIGMGSPRADAVTQQNNADFDSADLQHNAKQTVEFEKANSPFNPNGAATAPAFDLENLFPEAQTERSIFDRAAAPSPQSSGAPSRVPASPVFEEPRETADVKGLTIDPHLAAMTGGDQLASERYRTLGVRLGNLAARRKLKTIVITSATACEGKTTVAINLAWVMSNRGQRRVLLVDANLGYPSIVRALGVAPTYGWLDVAEGKSKLIDSIIRLDTNGLYIAAARSFASDEASTMDGLASSHIEKLTAEVGEQFDLIVIDAPSLLESADARELASIADGAVIVARAGHTHRASVSDAVNLVPEDRRLGVVLNESEIDAETAHQDQSKGRLFGRKKKRARGR
jgi:Mrp family chromosome partitioning ATPase